MGDIFVRFLAFPYRTKGVTIVDANADYNVYINSHLDPYRARKAYLHELEHIKQGHFWSSLTAWAAEMNIK